VGLLLAEETPGGVVIRLAWERVEDVPIFLANHALGQIGPQGEIILTFGQASLPILMGDEQQQQEQAKDIPFVPVRPVARLGLTRAALDDAIRVLNQTRDNWDKAQETALPPLESDEQ
jgi:hypothetical protein